MDLLFIVSWTSLFAVGIFLIRRHFISRKRLYMLLLLNLFFLVTLFYLYPLVLAMSGIA